jgi:N-acetylneuraminate synthase/pseudaminic acid synthase
MKNFIKVNNEKFFSSKPMIVAEISCNHAGNFLYAKKLILAAKKIGADAVKLQTFTPDTITLNSNKIDFKLDHVKNSSWKKYKNFYSIYKHAQTPYEWHSKLFAYARKLKIIIFSSPFDESSVDFLEKLNCPLYKLASPEITHIPLIKRIAKTKKPIFISTGLARVEDLNLAIRTIEKTSNSQIILMKCNSTYPAPEEESNLLNLLYFKKKYKFLFGLSDHTISDLSAIIATSLGAVVIEKHLKLSGSIVTLDSFFSLDTNKFYDFIKNIKRTGKILGNENYSISKSSIKNLKSRRSIYFSENIKIGEKISKNNIKVVRPGFGLHPKFYNFLIGKKAKRNAAKHTPLSIKYL